MLSGMSKGDAIVKVFRQAGVELPALDVRLERRPEGLLGFPVSSEDAIEMWERVRAATERTGWYPVLVGDENGMLDDLGPEEYPTPEETLKKAAGIELDPWLEQMHRDSFEIDLEGDPVERDGGDGPGAWPEDVEPLREITTPYTLEGEPRDDLAILLLPTREAWRANAYLAFTAWNDDVTPAHHVAMHQRWQERYGAELVACGGDTLEFRVARPPTTRRAALALAREQASYCPDIVIQGTDTEEALAAAILKAPVWYFWWD